MKKTQVFGIDFVPLNEPLSKKLEALAAMAMFVLFPGLFPIGICLTVYVLCFTNFWPLVIMYYIWIGIFDTEVVELGNRRSDWVLSWRLYKYVKNYYPVSSIREPEFLPDPKKNYLAAVFPHAAMPFASFIEAVTHAGNKDLLPDHLVYSSTLRWFFYVPLFREYLISIGMTVASAKSLNRLLSCSTGGNAASILVGGGSEMMHACGGQYQVTLKNRKGFIKLALANGSPIIPVFTYGETGIYRSNAIIESSWFASVQAFTKKILGFPIIFPHGRGLLQYNFGLIPLQKPITVVVGTPLEVPKVENPSKETIDEYHKKFTMRLTNLFEKYKYDYEKDPEHCKLIIM